MTQTGTRRFCFVTLFSRAFLPNGLFRAILNHLNIELGPDTSPQLVGGLYEQFHPIGLDLLE